MREGNRAIITLFKEAEESQAKRKEKKKLLSNDVKVDDIYSVVQLMKDSDRGVNTKDRRKWLISYRNTFSGVDAVDWMLSSLQIRSRAEAVALGQKILDAHFIQNLGKSNKPFKDGKALYQFVVRKRRKKRKSF
jgi:1-phosphatidylinositol-3-phosphate 5-kinase